MKKVISMALSVTMCTGGLTAFAAKDAPEISDSGYQISLDEYNLKSNGTKSANVTITKNGEEYTGNVTVLVDNQAVDGKSVSSTSEGIHKVTAEVDGETLTTYFSYTHQYSACAVKDQTPVFFEDFQDDTYEGEGAADLLDKTKYTGADKTNIYKWTDGATEGNRPGNTALNLATNPGEAFQTPAFGPELADYAVEYFFRGQSYKGTAQTVIGAELGLHYAPTDELPWNAYRIVYAPYGKRNGNSSIGMSGATRIWDVLAIGRTGKDKLKNNVSGYWINGIQTSSSNSGQSYTYNEEERTIPLNSNWSFTENKFYKMSAFAFSNTVAAKTYDYPTGNLLRSVSVDISNDYNIQVGDGANRTTISKGRTILGAQEYNWRVDDLAIYKLYNCKNIYANEDHATATVGEAVPVSVTLNGVDNNVTKQGTVNYTVKANDLTVYNEGLDFTIDQDASTVTFRKAGRNIVPLEYVGYNGSKKGIIKLVTVDESQSFQASEPEISLNEGTASAISEVKNTTYFDHAAKLYLAAYSDDGKLLGVQSSEDENFAPNTADTLSVQLTMPEGYSTENSYLKAFVWENMTPVSPDNL